MPVWSQSVALCARSCALDLSSGQTTSASKSWHVSCIFNLRSGQLAASVSDLLCYSCQNLCLTAFPGNISGEGETSLLRWPQRTLPPYPIEAKLRSGIRVIIRPIEPEDAEREQAFVRGLSPESRYFRFMNTLRELSPQMLESFTHPDAAREIALVALTGESLLTQQIGVARCALMQDGKANEFALVVADAFQGQGLGRLLMQALLNAANERGIDRIEGLVLNNNQRMLALMHSLGFETSSAPEDPTQRRVVKQLLH